ncbi:MAG: iron-sulfur cluster assembly accessory protein [ANME-2 cluster archaeon]|nr:iron-sulfur cluster assembly accessory protein [ANME-2 cluster archaeon]MDF1531339.1 iron-sulfur cluster assembly accessory protein [ANME-2 cluster archaeon]
MIEVTELAAGELKTLLEQENKQDHALRIFIAGMGCSGLSYGMTLDDTKKDDDLETTSNGVRLLMNSDIQESLDGAEIDYIDNEQGKGFVINNPNAPKCGSGCSC